MKTKNICMIAALILAFACSATGGVFDDAILWMRGPVDENGDGWVKTTRSTVDTKDLPDALKAGVSSAATHTWDGIGPYTNIHVVTDGEVAIPYANVKVRSSYLHFDQPSWVDGDVTNVLGGAIRTTAVPAMTNADPHTVFMRFRVDSFIDDGTPAVLCALGYASGTSGSASGWQLQLVPDGEGSFWFKVVQGRPKDNAGQTGVGTKELTGAYDSSTTRLGTNQWVDVVFTCIYDAIAVYSCGEGGAFAADESGIGWNSSAQATWPTRYCFGNAGTAFDAPTATVAAYRQFRGDIAQIACWNRILTEAEAREAMAWPRNDRFRLGVKDGTPDQFAGAAGAVVDASAVNAFAVTPPALAAGESFSVSFGMDVTNTLGSAQALRVRTTAASASSTVFAASVNGGREHRFLATAGGEGVAVFPAKDFAAGANTLTLTCVAVSGGMSAVFDSLALGGAFNIGYANDSHAEFAYTTTSGIRWKQRQLHAEDADWKRTVINLALSGEWATNTVRALVDTSVSDVRDGRFVLRGKSTGIAMRVELLVNGASAGSHTFPAGGSYGDAVYCIPAGTLTDGVNVFSVINRTVEDGVEAPTGYISMDCRYFEYVPDPMGTTIMFR